MRQIIIDTDVGYDDIIAILMLIISKKFNIFGISVVHGVSDLKYGIKNINSVLSSINYKLPIFSGWESALKEKNNYFPKIDRKRANNLSIISDLLNTIPSEKKLLNLDDLFQSIQNNESKFTFVCLGPLTNLAYLINKYGKKFTKAINELVIMGGVIEAKGKDSGLAPPYKLADYNFALDPEAAKIVMASKIKKTLIPIDVTYQAPACLEVINRKNNNYVFFQNFIKDISKLNLSKLSSKIIQKIILNNKRDFDYFYDPLVAGILINDKIMKEKIKGNWSVYLKGKRRGRMFRKTRYQKIKDLAISQINMVLFYKTLISLLRR